MGFFIEFSFSYKRFFVESVLLFCYRQSVIVHVRVALVHPTKTARSVGLVIRRMKKMNATVFITMSAIDEITCR